MNSLTPPCRLALALAFVGACPGDPATTSDTDTSSSTGTTMPADSTGTNSDSTATTAEPPSTSAEPTSQGTSTPTTTGTTDDTTTTSGPEEAGLWLVQLVSDASASAHSIVITEQGDVVVAGAFAGTLEIGDVSLTSAGALDLFVARWTAAGELLWASRFGGPGGEHEASITVGEGGDLLLAAEFSDTLEVPGLSPLVSQGMTDIFLLQLHGDGTPSSIRGFGGEGQELEPRAVVDADGSIFLAASFEGFIDVGGGPLAATDAHDLLLAKLDFEGGHLWSQVFANSADISAHDLALGEDGDVAVTGWFANAIDFGGGVFEDGGAYVVVVDGDTGVHRWSQQLGSGNSGGCGARFAADGGLAVTGWFQNAIDFGSGPIAANDEHADHFAARFGPDGELAWGGAHGGPNVDSGCALGAGPDGGWVLGGTFNQQIDLGGGPLTTETAPCAFLAGLDGDGGHRWSMPLCAASGGQVHRLATYPEGHVAFIAGFAGPVELFGQPLDAAKPYEVVAHVPAPLLAP
ncbi:hypothetical protein [Nannocystis punicea]|uniref:Uncharacterized protein n=1 Tax=Nannocystis punicea TaxID=2995304 RepID=A0ABY7H3T1_9BACT|nr:hypothetical protein [Nannocystis poenicansa]WAS93679.1 hypothetical protein O0S08_46700 [Nannocystis poenicansa]